jgi:hypothetical protein
VGNVDAPSQHHHSPLEHGRGASLPSVADPEERPPGPLQDQRNGTPGERSVPALHPTDPLVAVSEGAERQPEAPTGPYQSDTLEQPAKRRAVLVRGARSVSTLLAFVGAFLGVLFLLWPSLAPEGPPATQSATLEKPTLDRMVTFGQYLDRIELSRAPFDRSRLARRGALVEFDFMITGYRGKHLPLRWQLIDAESGNQLDQSSDTFITADATTDRGTWHVWVRSPKRRFRRLFVEIQLYDHSGRRAARTSENACQRS